MHLSFSICIRAWEGLVLSRVPSDNNHALEAVNIRGKASPTEYHAVIATDTLREFFDKLNRHARGGYQMMLRHVYDL
jgi:hypothetical protein